MIDTRLYSTVSGKSEAKSGHIVGEGTVGFLGGARFFSALGRSLRGITFSVYGPERSRTFSALGSRAEGLLLAL